MKHKSFADKLEGAGRIAIANQLFPEGVIQTRVLFPQGLVCVPLVFVFLQIQHWCIGCL